MALRMNWLMALAPALLGLLLLLANRRDADRRAWRSWNFVLGDLERSIVAWVRLHSDVHLRVLSAVLRVARADHERGRDDEARRVMGEADAHAARHIYMGLLRLNRWSDVARTVTMLGPLPALPSKNLNLQPLRRLALVERVAGYILGSESARFLFGLKVQRAALHLLGWSFAAAVQRAQRDNGVPQALRAMETSRDDLLVIDAHGLAALERLLTALPPDDTPTAAHSETAV